MFTRDPYVAILEKRASEDSPQTSIPENDSAAATIAEYKAIQEDSRQFLHDTFGRAAAVQENQSAEMKKLLPGLDGEKITGNPLLKMAFHQALIASPNMQKLASPIHLELSFQSFCDELEKIASHRA